MHKPIPSLLFSLSATSLSASSITTRAAFLVQPQHHATSRQIRPTATSTSLNNNAYGKGSEIWPECNEEPISLAASFPDGVIPEPALNTLEKESSNNILSTSADPPKITSSVIETASTPPTKTTGTKRRVIKRTLSHLLRSAAKASSRRAASDSEDLEVPAVVDKAPGILALILLGFNCVGVRHVVSVLLVTVYLIGVASWCAAPKLSIGSSGGEDRVNMASLPLKGHVPNLVSNPLGSLLTNSRLYRLWLRSGALLSLLLPVMALLTIGMGSVYRGGLESIFPSFIKDAFNSAVLSEPLSGVVKKLLGGHVFLLCCQALTEALARAALLPLPIRVLIPVTYNTLRLSSLHDWAFYPSVLAGELVLSTPLRVLGIANLLYWYANLLLFLPVAVLRYLRAHFYCVEAVEVTVRKGTENALGLLP